MPANTRWIDQVDFTAPGKIFRRSDFDARILRWQRLLREFIPILIEASHLVGDHLVFLPDRDVDVLQEEISTAESQAGKRVVTPLFDETQIFKEGQCLFEIRPGWNEWIQRFGLGIHKC